MASSLSKAEARMLLNSISVWHYGVKVQIDGEPKWDRGCQSNPTGSRVDIVGINQCLLDKGKLFSRQLGNKRAGWNHWDHKEDVNEVLALVVFIKLDEVQKDHYWEDHQKAANVLSHL